MVQSSCCARVIRVGNAENAQGSAVTPPIYAFDLDGRFNHLDPDHRQVRREQHDGGGCQAPVVLGVERIFRNGAGED